MTTPAQEKQLVANLSREMLRKLRVNRWKEHWCNLSALEARDALEEEVAELNEAVVNGDPRLIREECADVANFAAMIADNWGKKP